MSDTRDSIEACCEIAKVNVRVRMKFCRVREREAMEEKNEMMSIETESRSRWQ